MSLQDQNSSRRRFLQYLAASPLLAAGGMESFANELPSKLPDPMIWTSFSQQLIKAPKEAINVFDFEPVARQNVPPAHFGYMASGIDDEVTLRANRERVINFHLRPPSGGAFVWIGGLPAPRAQPIWHQLYATDNWDVAKAIVMRVEKAGALAVAVTVDRSGGRNQDTFFHLLG